MSDFAARRILLTGVVGGIGRAIALAMAGAGARVMATDLDEAGLVAAREGLAAAGVACLRLDVRDEDAIADLVAREGPFDGLVYSAGGVAGQVGRPIDAVSRADWDAITDINLTGTFLLARAVVPGMKAAGGGAMVVISSGAGIEWSLTGIQAYASSKAGQLGLVRQLAHELGSAGIRINAVAPGFVRSNPSSEAQWQALGEAGQRALLERIALRRIGEPADIADAVLFLLSDRASWITGQVLRVDGGR